MGTAARLHLLNRPLPTPRAKGDLLNKAHSFSSSPPEYLRERNDGIMTMNNGRLYNEEERTWTGRDDSPDQQRHVQPRVIFFPPRIWNEEG